MMRKTILAPATALALAGCSAGAEKTAAEAAVTQFHQMLDGARYGDIYAATSPDFRQATSEAQFTDLLQRVHALGAVRGASETGWQVNYNTSGHMVTLHYTTQFASGQAREDFIYRVNGSTANLVNYTVNSDAAPIAPPATPDPSTETPPPPPEPGDSSAPPPVSAPPSADKPDTGGDMGGK